MRRPDRDDQAAQAGAARQRPGREGDQDLRAQGAGVRLHRPPAAHHRTPAVLYRGPQGEQSHLIPTGTSRFHVTYSRYVHLCHVICFSCWGVIKHSFIHSFIHSFHCVMSLSTKIKDKVSCVLLALYEFVTCHLIQRSRTRFHVSYSRCMHL